MTEHRKKQKRVSAVYCVEISRWSDVFSMLLSDLIDYAQTRSCTSLVTGVLDGVPDTYHRVPGAGAQTHCVLAYAQATDAVFVAMEGANTLAAEDIPYLDSQVSVMP